MLQGRPKEAEGRQTHCHGCRRDSQWSVRQDLAMPLPPSLPFRLPSASRVPPDSNHRKSSDNDYGDHCSTILQLLSHLGIVSASILPPLNDLHFLL